VVQVNSVVAQVNSVVAQVISAAGEVGYTRCLLVSARARVRSGGGLAVALALDELLIARWLNGDKTHHGRHIQPNEFSMQRVKLYRYR
jgi:hypothetical protein